MAYIGNIPAEKFTSVDIQNFTVSATANYTLDRPVANENEIELFINNVRQHPGSGKAYTASGTALTLSEATAGTDTMYCVYQGKARQTVTPATSSVTNDMLAGSIDLTSKVTGALPQANIADQAINEAKLQISNAPTNGYMLTAQSGNTGGLTWAAAPSGGLVPLAQLASSSDVATIALDGFMDASSYAYYKVFAAVKSAGNGNVLECRFRDGGSALNANVYYYANHGYTADIGETTVGASPQNSASLFSDGSTHTAIFEFTIFPDDGISNQSMSRCFWTSSDSKYNSNTRKARTTRGAFHFINDTVPDGFHIHNDTSNFEDYAMYAYGVKKYS